ncbi:MAG: Glu-tRNA(Gln) amidotransferase subunit GatE [Candidatus Diapherotrites archaeon]|nr:Glu-tRNA(Gln) amidotransferase subunit GatE [Candidatus Diapherotrites archaeon]
MNNIDYAKLGLKAGLEVHQQLNTGKLFIRTQSKLSDEINFTVERKLRPVASELGEFDRTAKEAFKRNETFYYQGNSGLISLVETDEEPPQPLDKDAFKTILEVASLCNSNIVNEAVVMRKAIVDGSNTSAFQRTMLVSLGGEFEIAKGKKIRVQTIVLEEDAARPIKKEAGKIYYNLDRLGIPLIELATEPDIRTPGEAIETAKKIGEMMRLTGKTKRGKGTIRQDVNVSIAEGARVEVKGCQDLAQIGLLVEKEVQRQLDLLDLKIAFRKLSKEYLFGEIKDISQILSNSDCKFVCGKKVFGMKLTRMKGFLGKKVGTRRFGSELSDYAKATGVTGLIHMDELPNYGISNIDSSKIAKVLECTEHDNFVFIVANEDKARAAFESVKERIMVAFDGVPEETRGAVEDGSSVYQRPLAGEARMYPETDLLTQNISAELLTKIKKGLPKSVAEREKLYAKLGLSSNHISEMKLNNYARFFASIVKKGANAGVAANLLLQTLKELKRNEVETEDISTEDIGKLLLLEKSGKINKNNLKKAIVDLARGESVENILSGQSKMGVKTIITIIEGIVQNNKELVKQKGLGAIGPLMGDVMKEEKLRGVDGKLISEVLRNEIEKIK